MKLLTSRSGVRASLGASCVPSGQRIGLAKRPGRACGPALVQWPRGIQIASYLVAAGEPAVSTPAIAQLAEHLIVDACSNQIVPGSIPGGRSFAIARWRPRVCVRSSVRACALSEAHAAPNKLRYRDSNPGRSGEGRYPNQLGCSQ